MPLVVARLLSLAFVGLVACGAPPAPSPTPTSTSAPATLHVTANQVAQSMQEDQFFAQYGDTPLLIEGTVLAIQELSDRTRVQLATGLPLTVVCETLAASPAVSVGQAVTIVSTHPRSDASRNADWVLFSHCSLGS